MSQSLIRAYMGIPKLKKAPKDVKAAIQRIRRLSVTVDWGKAMQKDALPLGATPDERVDVFFQEVLNRIKTVMVPPVSHPAITRLWKDPHYLKQTQTKQDDDSSVLTTLSDDEPEKPQAKSDSSEQS